jgi:hypothetical protein
MIYRTQGEHIYSCKQEISIYISVIKDDSTNQIKVYWDGGWIWLCYSDDLTLALYLCSITGYGFVYTYNIVWSSAVVFMVAIEFVLLKITYL